MFGNDPSMGKPMQSYPNMPMQQPGMPQNRPQQMPANYAGPQFQQHSQMQYDPNQGGPQQQQMMRTHHPQQMVPGPSNGAGAPHGQPQMNQGMMMRPGQPQMVQQNPHMAMQAQRQDPNMHQYGPGPSRGPVPQMNGVHPGYPQMVPGQQVQQRQPMMMNPSHQHQQQMMQARAAQQAQQQQQQPMQAFHNGQNVPNPAQGRPPGMQMNQGVPPGQPPPYHSGADDPAKRKLIQQQLVLLLHAHKCQPKEQELCSLPHCSTMKEVLVHMKGCGSGKVCKYAHCASSHQIIAHWKSCTRPECSVCGPLKMQLKNGVNPGSVSFINRPQSNEMSQMMSPEMVASQQQFVPHLHDGQVQAQPQPQPQPRPPVPEVRAPLPTPDAAKVPKPWHMEIKIEERGHLVGKLVNAILPSPGPNARHDQRVKEIIGYARRSEREIFESADNREEYYQLLAEKIYKVQKELVERKKNRKPADPVPIEEQPAPKRMKMSPAPSEPGPSIEQPSTSTADRPPSVAFSVKSEPIEEKPPTIKIEVKSVEKVVEEVKVQTPTKSLEVKKIEQRPIKKELSPPPGEITKIDADTLRSHIRPVLEVLNESNESFPFREPVDEIRLGIVDYYKIVKDPMDLHTMGEKLDHGDYEDAWKFVDDFWLMMDNAWLYNKKNSKVYKMATRFAEIFVAEMDPVMRSMGYCCAQKLSYTPLALFCYGAAACTIARDQQYMLYEHKSSSFEVEVCDRYTYCMKCFEKVPPEGVNLSDNPADTSNMARKEEFKLKTNNEINMEPFESCKYCTRKWHRICALYDKKIYPEDFVCDTCRKERANPRPKNMFTAKRLPHNKLSMFLEDRVNRYIKRNNSDTEEHEVIVRTLCVQDKDLEVNQQMRTKYGPEGFPASIPYRTKAVFAFEVIDGVEVCFFGLHVQEYGSNSPNPNQRRVYIAYLDSVHFFQPRELRTDVYHEIVLGYLDYAKGLGYTVAHIWACPPYEGDDYIFPCHPPDQRIPKPKRLQDWYKNLLDKGKAEKTVYEYKDILKQAKEDNLMSPMELPYFDGDFWPNILEDCIREANCEDAKRKKEGSTYIDEYDPDSPASGSTSDKKKSSKSKKPSKKNTKMNKKKQGTLTGNTVTDKLYGHLEKHKDVFFTVRLISKEEEVTVVKTPIKDPDPLMPSEMMDGRDNFLTKSRDEHWEFSSLRRAKYSTLILCHALHDSGKESFRCNACSQTSATLHCTVCDDFDLCTSCQEADPHPHKMEPINMTLTGGDAATNSKQESIQKCLQSLVHACRCRDANCRRWSCHKMKKVVQHVKACKLGSSNCRICKQSISLICYHAKVCHTESCSIPYCTNIKRKLQEQKRSMARRSDMMMRRRMEGLRPASTANSSASHSPAASGASTPPTSNPSSVKVSADGATTNNNLATSNNPTAQRHSPNYTVSTSMSQQLTPGHPASQVRTNSQHLYPHGPQSVPMQNPGSMAPPARPASATINQLPLHRTPSQPSMMPPQQHPGMNSMSLSQMRAPSMTGQQQQLDMAQQRLRNTQSHQERQAVYNDLKKTPHLLQALLQNKPEGAAQQPNVVQVRPQYSMGAPQMAHPGYAQQQQGYASQGQGPMNQQQFGQVRPPMTNAYSQPGPAGHPGAQQPGQRHPQQPPQGFPPRPGAPGSQFR